MYPNRGIGKCYLCLLVRIEYNKISLITLPSLRQEFSDITCEFFDLAFTLATFPTFWACTSWYKLRKVFCRFADDWDTGSSFERERIDFHVSFKLDLVIVVPSRRCMPMRQLELKAWHNHSNSFKISTSAKLLKACIEVKVHV